MNTRATRAGAFAVALLFGCAAFVQGNDPDPIPWIVAYGTVALLWVAAGFGRHFTGATALALLGYVAAIGLRLPALGDAGSISVSSFHMVSEREELAREAWGLVLCAVACGALLARGWRRRRRASAPAGG